MREITSLEELKAIELDVMKKIHIFCEENNITYYLAYGTLIGAMRHNGFIPWDDDIDIWMMREDYEKFIQLFPKFGERNNLYIATYNTKPRFPRNMLKVCDNRTVLHELEYDYQDDFGVFVDIWPLDGSSNSVIERNHDKESFEKLLKIFYATITKKEYFKFTIKKLIARFIGKIIGPEYILKKMVDMGKKYPTDSSDVLFMYAGELKEYRAIDFKGKILHKFEDAEFYVPSGYDRILTERYGNWRELPPVEQRKPHHIMNTYWK